MENQSKPQIKNWIIFALLLGLFLICGKLALNNQEDREARDEEFFTNGTAIGYQYAIQQITSIAVTCEQIPITVGNNQTINLIAIECLQQQKN